MPYLHIAVVLNGEYPHPERQLALLERCDYVIAADGGLNWLHAQGHRADALVGDLDSVTPEALQACRESDCIIHRYPPEKDETDAELALTLAASMNPSRITLLGATGGRIDHLIANVLLLSMDVLARQMVAIYDGQSWTSVVRSQTTIEGVPGDTLSLIALGGDAEGVSTSGLYYPLDDEPLSFGPARGVSNILTESQAIVRLRRGLLLVVHTPTTRGESHHG